MDKSEIKLAEIRKKVFGRYEINSHIDDIPLLVFLFYLSTRMSIEGDII